MNKCKYIETKIDVTEALITKKPYNQMNIYANKSKQVNKKTKQANKEKDCATSKRLCV